MASKNYQKATKKASLKRKPALKSPDANPPEKQDASGATAETDEKSQTELSDEDKHSNAVTHSIEKLSMINIFQRNRQDTGLTELEKKDIREAFDILDNDNDGKLSTAELETLLRGQFVVASNRELKELLENMDTDHNGTVEYEEFEAFVRKNGLCKADADQVSDEMKDAFKVFDSDGDGYIDVEEFKTVMMTVGDKMSEEEIQKMMKDADVNGDGKIDYKEFCTFMSKGLY